MSTPAPQPPTSYTADHAAFVALHTDNRSVLDYHSIAHFTQWCERNHLYLNVRKTKEIGDRYPITPAPHPH